MPTERPTIAALNGLRGLAALIVFLSHFLNATGPWGRHLGMGGGQIGVMIFFVLSGFLMAYLYLDLPFDRDRLIRYVRARLGRVAPLYLLLVLASLVVLPVASRTAGWGSTWVLVYVAWLVWASASSRWAETLLGGWLPTFFGTISYSLYLLHWLGKRSANRVPDTSRLTGYDGAGWSRVRSAERKGLAASRC